ncbi:MULTISPECIES: NAD(P)/FAD-dependent oxidoreductase [Prochlorococcus]|uniref:NAD(P)/FAD-dependent oxidoreductase n=1 Tax=Prochlorococcus TaxID=1218 RepID=UPI0005337688|nr:MULTISPECIES: FAD-dependent oxidoreductase [Prochlorococcus]KGG13340.1 Glycine oxidase ThiO [Prochlorococcus sp. MIT 0601]
MVTRKTERLLILGGGLIGLAIAHELARKGRAVEILSRSRNEAAGFVAAGMLAPHAEGLSKSLLEFGRASLFKIPEWIKEIEKNSQINCGLRFCGIIVPFLNDEARNNYPTAYLGEILSRQDLEKEIPGIGFKWKTGLLFPKDGQIDNRRLLMKALQKACVALGVRFREGVEVLELITKANTFEGVLVSNEERQREKIYSKEALLCCGAWSNQLLKKIPIFPVKGQMFSIQGPQNTLQKILFGPGIYLVPREDGLIVVGATSEKKVGFTEGLTPHGQQELQKGMHSLLPHASSWPQMERWWGFRPCTPDSKPILGTSPIQGLWLATGHNRNGVLLSAITSELLAKSICNESLTDEEKEFLKIFNWNRFLKQN